jgi:DNA-binding CsgD family transcriptional regulator
MTSPDNAPTPLPALTETERRCLDLAAHGRTPADIALETGIAMAAVADATRSAIDKLGARNITGAITRAARLDLI